MHVQIAATNLGTTPSRIHLVQSDTDRTGFDTGAFASAGMFVAGNAVNYASTALRKRILGFAASHTGVDVADCALDDDGVVCGGSRLSLAELARGRPAGGASGSPSRARPTGPRAASRRTPTASGSPCTGSPARSGSCTACTPPTPGVIINPAQVRGQVDGGVAMGLGFALTENFHVDDNGVMINPNLRNYRIPTYADVPRTELLFVKSNDSVGPMKAKGMAECCINPIAPALANALEDATGVRYRDLPLSPERIYSRLAATRVIATT